MTYEAFLLVFLGGIGVMTLSMGVQAIITGERVYRYYALYSLCWIAYFLIKELWVFDNPIIESIIHPFSRIGFPMLAYVFYYRFANSFLDLRRFFPIVFRLFRFTEYMLLTYTGFELIVCFFFNDWTNSMAHEWLHTIMRILVAIISVYGITKVWSKQNPLAHYFIVGSGLLLVFSLLAMVLSILDTDDSGHIWILNNPILFMNVGILLELFCFSLGLSYKNKQTEIRKITVEQEVIREREQRELAQLKTQFFTNISHEFRTPLTLILGPLTELVQKSPTQEIYQLMHRNASRLLTLVNQLLDLSKLDAGQLQPDMQTGNLTEWLQLLISSFSSLAESRYIQLGFFAKTNTFDTAHFDRDKTEKIVSNLLSNALKFTPAGGSVRLHLTESSKGEAVIQVQDTGIGIPVDQQVRIFERFHQVSSNGQHPLSTEGSGIGLALVRELVAVLQGSVSVESRVEHGTTFTVTLPVHLPDGPLPVSLHVSPVPATSDPQPPTSPLERPADSLEPHALATDLPMLLIIDDNADVRQYLRHILQADFRITEAVDGLSGLKKATQTIPDIVICDWMMPAMDGMAFCQALKTQSTTDHIPVIMLTAKASTENRIEGFGHGADDYLTKPFHPNELKARVSNLLTQRNKLRERFSREVYLKPTDVQVSSVEEVFIRQAITILESHISDSSFSVEQLAAQLNLSRMQLHRKLKALTNQSATEFVRNLRLQRAASLLAARSGTVSEIAFSVGFESLSYFSKSFKEKFGMLPSEYEALHNPVT